MSSVFDKNLLPEFDSVKDDDEQIILTQKPKFIPYIFTGLGSSLYLIAFSVVWILISLDTKPYNDSTGGFFWLFGLLSLLQGLYTFGKKLFSFSNISNPYDIFKKVKEVMVDIKTDYNYPNALRPDTNPGYKTKYDRKN